jgi:hypothetical protein
MRIAAVLMMFATTAVVANTEIHRCVQEDGTIAFQATPCPEPSVDVGDDSESVEDQGTDEEPIADDHVFDVVSPADEPESVPPTAEPALPEALSQDRAECEKTTRDAIDTIDLEMREQAYTKEQGEAYLARLLQLTEQLRACKQL